MAHFIDKRDNAKGKSTVNRQRFMRRYKQQIKKAVSEQMADRSVTDGQGENITIPKKDLSEPFFHTTSGGNVDRVLPGNDVYSPGDTIPRPPPRGGQGQGGGDASDSGEGTDEFAFEISHSEYLDLLFEDLELPNLEENHLDKLVSYKIHRAGFNSDGMPSNLDIVRSLKGSIARRIALTSNKRRSLNELQEEYQRLLDDPHDNHLRLDALLIEIETLQKRIKAVPFIDTFDLRFRNFEKRPHPTSRAVMFCLMDVSGSMDQATKDMAKRFYIMLYLFLSRTYENVEVVYIRHHTIAKEVSEQDFFYSKETGGTIVSSALKLMSEIIHDRYNPEEWNIYAAQASDGDNWADDSPQCSSHLASSILPAVRYYAYIEITSRPHQSLWREYQTLTTNHDNLACAHIQTVSDIYPVFRELFKKQTH